MVFLFLDGVVINFGLVSGLIIFFKWDKLWVVFVWCFFYCFELVLKDVLFFEFELVEELL